MFLMGLLLCPLVDARGLAGVLSEDALWRWCAEVDGLLVENDENRVRDPDVGPHSELRYWTHRALQCQVPPWPTLPTACTV